jgi:2-amino-4-hydroxy-6-hydroxymethyldihydropteridine diphosphokinase
VSEKENTTHTIYISVGSNIEREQNVRAGLQAMFLAFGELRLSSVYESESVGFSGSNFYNLVVQAHTSQTVPQVCARLKSIEEENHRIRGDKKFAPRTLDLDLLLYDDVVDNELVELPRAEILFNAFVLQPLAEIAATELHPLVGRTYQALWDDYDKSTQKLWPVKFTWSATPE